MVRKPQRVVVERKVTTCGKKNGKVVELWVFWMFFLDVFLGENFGSSKKKHPGGWKKVRFWMMHFQVTVFLFGVPAKQKQPQEAQENVHVLEI